MSLIPQWLQATAAVALALMTYWALFWSDLPEALLTQLRAEIGEAKEEIRELKRNKASLDDDLTLVRQALDAAKRDRKRVEETTIDWIAKRIGVRARHKLQVNAAIAEIGIHWEEYQTWTSELEKRATEGRPTSTPVRRVVAITGRETPA